MASSNLRTSLYIRSQILNSHTCGYVENLGHFSQEWICRRKYVSLECKGIYNPAVKEQVRKDKFGKDTLSFMILGSQDQKKQIFFSFLKTWFYGFSHSNYVVNTRVSRF